MRFVQEQGYVHLTFWQATIQLQKDCINIQSAKFLKVLRMGCYQLFVVLFQYFNTTSFITSEGKSIFIYLFNTFISSSKLSVFHQVAHSPLSHSHYIQEHSLIDINSQISRYPSWPIFSPMPDKEIRSRKLKDYKDTFQPSGILNGTPLYDQVEVQASLKFILTLIMAPVLSY